MKPLLYLTFVAGIGMLGACGSTVSQDAHSDAALDTAVTAADALAPVTDTPLVQATVPTAAMPDSAARVNDGAQRESLDFLRPYKGEYAHDIKLLENKKLKTRLEELMGKDKYTWMETNWQVTTPIEVENDWFYAWGMKAHEGGDPGMVIMADLQNNVLYVALKNQGEDSYFSENNASAPPRMQKWMAERK